MSIRRSDSEPKYGKLPFCLIYLWQHEKETKGKAMLGYIKPSVLFFCVLIMTGTFSIGRLGAEPVQIIAGEAAYARTLAENLTIVDVRTPSEWRQTGLPAGAKGATIYRGYDQSEFLAEIAKITGGDKNAPVALICARGVRSARAAEILNKAGYSHVYDIQGGMLGNQQSRGWAATNLPIRSCEKC